MVPCPSSSCVTSGSSCVMERRSSENCSALGMTRPCSFARPMSWAASRESPPYAPKGTSSSSLPPSADRGSCSVSRHSSRSTDRTSLRPPVVAHASQWHAALLPAKPGPRGAGSLSSAGSSSRKVLIPLTASKGIPLSASTHTSTVGSRLVGSSPVPKARSSLTVTGTAATTATPRTSPSSMCITVNASSSSTAGWRERTSSTSNSE
eukprot:scaffold89524_cov72-Phaeocystis_antarctica.AAC.1